MDSTISCGSCHKTDKSFADDLKITPGVNGALGTRIAMTLVNLAWYEAFQWNGQETTIRDQNVHPVESMAEMAMLWPELVDRLKGHEEYPGLFEKAFPRMKQLRER